MTALHDKLHARFEQDGQGEAVLLGRAGTLSYAQFGHAIALMQDRLSAEKVSVLGVLSTRQPATYVMVLAAFLSGIRFVPLNPELPSARLSKIIDLAGIDIVGYDSSTESLAQSLAHACIDATADLKAASAFNVTSARHPRRSTIAPQQIAYQMFTSGSTGNPKGVPVSYASLSHYVTRIISDLAIPEGGRFSQLFDLSFDLSLHDIFVCFAQGGLLCPAGQMDLLMPHAYIAKKKLTVWFSVPLLAAIATRGLDGRAPIHYLEMAMFCGEPLPYTYAEEFLVFMKSGGALFNLYGPTEATIAITAKRFDPVQAQFSSVPLGMPFGQNRIAIEREDGRIVAADADVEGELLLGGPQVFSGYSPAEDKPIFVHDGPTHYYRSGDIVRVQAGEIIHMGRSDGQIKLRGYRIELGDIEAAWRKAFGCHVVCALVLGEGENKFIGLAYAADEPIADISALEQTLPSYMMPRLSLWLTELPVNVNGKIDRNALRQMTWPD